MPAHDAAVRRHGKLDERSTAAALHLTCRRLDGRYVELRRHTDTDGDAPTKERVQAAQEIGRTTADGYALPVSTGAQPASQTPACVAAMVRARPGRRGG